MEEKKSNRINWFSFKFRTANSQWMGSLIMPGIHTSFHSLKLLLYYILWSSSLSLSFVAPAPPSYQWPCFLLNENYVNYHTQIPASFCHCPASMYSTFPSPLRKLVLLRQITPFLFLVLNTIFSTSLKCWHLSAVF